MIRLKKIYQIVLTVIFYLFAAVFSLAYAADAAQCEPQSLSVNYPSLIGKTIKIGADPQTPPYVFRDAKDFSKIVGIDADMARAVMDCAGLKYEFVLGSWSGLLPAVQSGQIDIMWDDLYHNPQRAKVVNFATYMTAATGALVTNENPKKITSLHSLCGLTASFAMGSSNEILVKKQNQQCINEGKQAINMLPFQDLASGLRLLDTDRTDVIMWDLGFVDNLASNHKNKYARAFTINDGFLVGIALDKKNTALLDAVYNAIKAIQLSGKQIAIFKQYGVDPQLESASVIKTD